MSAPAREPVMLLMATWESPDRELVKKKSRFPLNTSGSPQVEQ